MAFGTYLAFATYLAFGKCSAFGSCFGTAFPTTAVAFGSCSGTAFTATAIALGFELAFGKIVIVPAIGDRVRDRDKKGKGYG